jgi:hypothetical protein
MSKDNRKTPEEVVPQTGLARKSAYFKRKNPTPLSINDIE